MCYNFYYPASIEILALLVWDKMGSMVLLIWKLGSSGRLIICSMTVKGLHILQDDKNDKYKQFNISININISKY